MAQQLHYKVQNVLHRNVFMCTKRYVEEYSIGALFIVAQNWKQPRCSPTVEWINHGVFIAIQWKRILQNNENEQAPATHYMERSHTNVQGKKPDTKVYMLYDAMCMSLNMFYFNNRLTKTKRRK